MSKNNNTWSERKFTRFIKEGRGQGRGSGYKPWLTIQDFPSKGRVSRLKGWKTNRIHHFFTDTQTRFFYLLEWEDAVIDIREHFPLFNLEEKIDTKDINMENFKDKESGFPYTISTSFLITIKDCHGNLEYAARSIKADYELEKKRTLDRLELERRYWKAKGIDWGILTQKEINKTKAKNIEWIHAAYFLLENEEKAKDLGYLTEVLQEELTKSSLQVRLALKKFDEELKLETGTALMLFKHLIARKKIVVDLEKEIKLNLKPDELIARFNEKVREGEGLVSNC
ncbi:TnsA endonuclease C-terminal domain-containing protein [Proteinivorax tanatarense]|uniref:TnsA endonuclease C-terminal domain-containing protein n=1 Tax=Proteinivorax tanatarense TaxID=1260629 RepID=A0AAU7VM51_9FIRM